MLFNIFFFSYKHTFIDFTLSFMVCQTLLCKYLFKINKMLSYPEQFKLYCMLCKILKIERHILTSKNCFTIILIKRLWFYSLSKYIGEIASCYGFFVMWTFFKFYLFSGSFLNLPCHASSINRLSGSASD